MSPRSDTTLLFLLPSLPTGLSSPPPGLQMAPSQRMCRSWSGALPKRPPRNVGTPMGARMPHPLAAALPLYPPHPLVPPAVPPPHSSQGTGMETVIGTVAPLHPSAAVSHPLTRTRDLPLPANLQPPTAIYRWSHLSMTPAGVGTTQCRMRAGGMDAVSPTWRWLAPSSASRKPHPG